MKQFSALLLVAVGAFSSLAIAGLPPIGAAPKGDANEVASRIIKYNFPACKRVTGAVRQSDGSIAARCDGTLYLVFTMFNPKEGKTIEAALNCAAAKSLLNVSCER